MPPAGSQLVEGALVSLDVGREAEPLLCRIVAFGGDDVVLAPKTEPDPDQQVALARGVESYLLLDAGNDVRALRCRPSKPTEAGDVVAEITDHFRLGQRRMFSRADLVLPVTVTPLDGAGQPAGEAWKTFTRDVSAGGVRLARQSGYAAAANLAVVIQLPAGERPVKTVVEIRRETDNDLGMRFLRIDADDRVRLEQAAIIWQRTRLKLAAEAAAAAAAAAAEALAAAA
jgi:PilZ domain-containing protein